MDDYNPKVVARIKPLLDPAKYFNAEEVPTSVLEYVVYECVRVWSRYRKQHEIDYLIATVARVKRSKHAYLLEFLKEFWCDSPNGLSKLLESGQREQIVLFCPGQILQVDHGRQVSGQGE